MNLKIADLMVRRIISARPHHTVEHVRGLLANNRIHAVPVVGPEQELLGLVSTADLISDLKAGTPVGSIMTEDVRAIPAYNDVSAAARLMRKHKVHHAVVTHEKKVVGMISSFDLLKLVEGHRYTMHAAPTGTKKSRRGG